MQRTTPRRSTLSGMCMMWLAGAALAAPEGPPPLPAATAEDVVLVSPIFTEYTMCGEHAEGELAFIGDALGSDCVIHKLEEIDGRSFARAYRGDGARNEDWYGWRAEVVAPCDCKVVRVMRNEVTNEPGVLGKPPASAVLLERADGVRLILAHLEDFRVEAGQSVRTGQVLGLVGNNGYGRSPHVHIGAWRAGRPLQIRFDLRRASGQ